MLSVVLPAIVYFALSLGVFSVVYFYQPNPFIDEIFHIPQAISYCNGSFDKWDPKITTLPGLYVISTGAFYFIYETTGHFLCNVYTLRLTSLMCAVSNFILTYNILRKERILQGGKEANNEVIWSTINISLFPILYLYTFFYYTDALSTCLVLLMYQMHLSFLYSKAAIAGLFAILVRQTNVVWVGFLVLDGLEKVSKEASKRLSIKSSKDNSLAHLFKVYKKLLKHIFRQGPLNGCMFFLSIHFSLLGYILLCLMFLVFVFINGGIVVGDKSAHQPVIHVPQLFYFSLLVIFFCIPHIYEKIILFFQHLRKFWKTFIICVLFMVFVAYYNTLVHPYLLADNRHYTFYLWKKVYERHFIVKYVLVPIYLFGFFCIADILKHKSIFFRMGYIICLLMCLIPQKLLEFRYFILPFLFLRLHIKGLTHQNLILESLLFIAVNTFTLYIFITKQFYWSDSPHVQRIIW